MGILEKACIPKEKEGFPKNLRCNLQAEVDCYSSQLCLWQQLHLLLVLREKRHAQQKKAAAPKNLWWPCRAPEVPVSFGLTNTCHSHIHQLCQEKKGILKEKSGCSKKHKVASTLHLLAEVDYCSSQNICGNSCSKYLWWLQPSIVSREKMFSEKERKAGTPKNKVAMQSSKGANRRPHKIPVATAAIDRVEGFLTEKKWMLQKRGAIAELQRRQLT